MSYRDWHVGMKVVCVEREDDPVPPNPVFGEVYTVSWIGLSVGLYSGEVIVDLVEMPNPGCRRYERGYQASIFRPVKPRKTDISIFTAMLSPERGKVEA